MFNQSILQRLKQLQEQRAKQAFLNVQSLYNLGFPIEQYVQLGSITAEQYKKITGQDYEIQGAQTMTTQTTQTAKSFSGLK